jgi:hypothetical protein
LPEVRAPSRHRLVLAALAILAALISGCGSSNSGLSAVDPATGVPASAPLYIGAVIQPSGALKSDAVTVARQLTHLQAPYEALLAALQGEGSTHITWSQLKPWVGERAGLFLQSLGSSVSPLALLEKGLADGTLGALTAKAAEGTQIQGALLLDVNDAAKARAFLQAQAGSGAHSSSVDGVTYQVGAGARAYGLVGKFAVIGTPAALRGVIETVHGGPSLKASDSYRQLSAAASGRALASAYLNPATLLAGAQRSGGGSEGMALLGGILSSASPVYVSLMPSPGSIELEALSSPPSGEESEGAAEQVFGQLPSNSWLAAGIGDLGKRLAATPQALQGLSSLESSSGLGSLLPKVDTKGLDLQREFFSWMGPAGVFAAGTNLLNIAAGLVITSTNPAASRAAVAKVGKLLSGSSGSVAPLSLPDAETALTVHPAGSPLTIDVADGHGKFAIGLGEQSVIQALSPTSTLAGSPTYSTAQSTLGGALKPTLMVDFPTLLGFMEGLSLQENATLGKVIPYLRQLDVLTAGSGKTGSLTRSRAVLSLR